MPGRRGEIAMSEAEVRAFLADQMVMQCATIGPHGRPHLMPLWYVPEGVELVSWTYAKSQKSKNLERDPRATVGIEDGVLYHELRGVTFECDVELEREPERVETYGLRLFERYAGELTDEIRAMVAQQATKRVGMRFVPSRTVSWNHAKLGGAY
jgi:PPOX class probable F420-dependent enzyme